MRYGIKPAPEGCGSADEGACVSCTMHKVRRSIRQLLPLKYDTTYRQTRSVLVSQTLHYCPHCDRWFDSPSVCSSGPTVAVVFGTPDRWVVVDNEGASVSHHKTWLSAWFTKARYECTAWLHHEDVTFHLDGPFPPQCRPQYPLQFGHGTT